MARVTLPVQQIKGALDDLVKRIQAAVRSLPNTGELALDIPEPFYHIVVGPHAKKEVCLAPSPYDECGDFAILLGVLKGVTPAGVNAPAPPTRPKQKK